MVQQFISLGGGVQSSVMCLMAEYEYLEKPTAAIHADTGWDPPTTLEMVNWLKSHVSYPVSIVQSYRGSLADVVRNPSGPNAFVPAPTYYRVNGKTKMGHRQCTSHWKIYPVVKEIRRLLGYLPDKNIPLGSAVQWIGYSTDEITRVKVGPPKRNKWLTNSYPLIDLNMSRQDCVDWWNENVPGDAPKLSRSSCVGCPYHSQAEWVHIADNYPEELQEAAKIEQEMNDRKLALGEPLHYFSQRCIPLLESVAADRESVASKENILNIGSDGGICESGCYT